jgi:general L-amino acid transport system substrate-binding protein
MKFIGFAAAAACLVAAPSVAQQLAPSPTLDAVKARGHIECGVHLGLPGFSFANDKGEWTGLDVDYCKSLAAAVLGDASKVKFTPTSVQQRWPCCSRARSTCWRATPPSPSRATPRSA